MLLSCSENSSLWKIYSAGGLGKDGEILHGKILKVLQDRLVKTGLSVSATFSVLSHQGALAYPDSLVTSEPMKKMNDIYKKFKIKCPAGIPYTLTENERARM